MNVNTSKSHSGIGDNQMISNGTREMNINRIARITGFLYGPLMLVLAPFGIIYVPIALVVAGDAAATANNITEHIGLFRLSIFATLIVAIAHIFIVLLLYKILRPVNKDLAWLMVIFMLVSIPFGMLNELNRVAIVALLSGADYLTAIPAEQLQAQALLLHNVHQSGIEIEYVFWGLWLLPMGYLVLRSEFISSIPGILLIVSGLGYVVDFVARLVLVEYTTSPFATVISATQFCEIIFPFWLLIAGVNVKKWRNAHQTSIQKLAT